MNTVATGTLKDCTNSLNCSYFIALVSTTECDKAAREVTPVNTQAHSNCANKHFKEWASNQSAMTPDYFIPPNMLKVKIPIFSACGYADM